jgi:hypothetical protein
MNLQNLIRSAGLIDDALVRPFNRFSQKVVNRRGKTFLPNFSGRNAVQNQVGSFTPSVPLPRNANSPVYTQGGAQRFAAEYGTGAPNVPAAAASVSKPGWQGNVLGAATTAVGLLGDPFGISEALLRTAGKPNQSRMSLLGGVNTDPLVPNVSSATGANTRRPEGYSSYGTYTVGGIEYDINSGRPTYMPPGSVYPSSSVAPLSPAAERDYQSKKSAAAQQVAQDPALSKYDRDRAAAIASGDQAKMDAVRDQGMAIWQQKYGGTPMGRTGGAVGSFNPLMDRTFGYQTGMSPAQMAEMQKTAAPIQVAPGQVPYQQGDLGTRATLETGYDPAAFGLTPEKIEEMKKQLLQQASK